MTNITMAKPEVDVHMLKIEEEHEHDSNIDGWLIRYFIVLTLGH